MSVRQMRQLSPPQSLCRGTSFEASATSSIQAAIPTNVVQTAAVPAATFPRTAVPTKSEWMHSVDMMWDNLSGCDQWRRQGVARRTCTSAINSCARLCPGRQAVVISFCYAQHEFFAFHSTFCTPTKALPVWWRRRKPNVVHLERVLGLYLRVYLQVYLQHNRSRCVLYFNELTPLLDAETSEMSHIQAELWPILSKMSLP